jgi:excinuclease UvrABC nuclease subunit
MGYIMDSTQGWFLKELEFSKIYKIDDLLNNTIVRNNIEIKTSSKFTYSEIPNKKAGIYIYYDKDKTPIYVGKTKDLRSRHSQHMHDSCSSVGKRKSEVKYYAYAIVDDILERNIYEMLYIGKYKPELNSDRDTKN